jgi:hypothetical protein
VGGVAKRRGPVALRPRLSPGVPLSRCSRDVRCGPGLVKCGPQAQRPAIRGRALENLGRRNLVLCRGAPAFRLGRRELHVTAHAAVLALVTGLELAEMPVAETGLIARQAGVIAPKRGGVIGGVSHAPHVNTGEVSEVKGQRSRPAYLQGDMDVPRIRRGRGIIGRGRIVWRRSWGVGRMPRTRADSEGEEEDRSTESHGQPPACWYSSQACRLVDPVALVYSRTFYRRKGSNRLRRSTGLAWRPTRRGRGFG